jgi:hypothetical protein
MEELKVGDEIQWKEPRSGNRYRGYIAAFVPKGEKIPDWFIDGQRHPKGVRFRTHQLVSNRDDRWIVDCGMSTVYEKDGVTVDDVVYHMVPTWNDTIVLCRT